MLEPGQKVELSFELPDFEKIFTLSVVCVVSAILLSISFIVELMWADSIFNIIDSHALDMREDYREIVLFIGGLVYALAAFLFWYSTYFSIRQLFNLTIKGENYQIRKAVHNLIHACLVAGLALLFLVMSLLVGELKAFFEI